MKLVALYFLCVVLLSPLAYFWRMRLRATHDLSAEADRDTAVAMGLLFWPVFLPLLAAAMFALTVGGWLLKRFPAEKPKGDE